MTAHKVSLTLSTLKMGDTPSVSLDPELTCNPALPCWGRCNVRRLLHVRPAVRACWRSNTMAALQDRDRYFAAVGGFLAAELPPFFRFHVGGDIPDGDYFKRMVKLARAFPATRILCFTKRHDLDLHVTENLTVRASVWPGWGDVPGLRRRRLPIAWMQDGREDRLPRKTKPCSARCQACRHFCWKSPLADVVFYQH